MGGLFHSLGIGSESLFTNRQGVDTTAHNIANAQTEGYSRQDVHLQQRDPSIVRGHPIGNGVYVGSIKRSHDKFIEKQLNQHTSAEGESSQVYKALEEFQLIFSPEMNASIAEEISDFFAKMQIASNMPDDLTARTALTDQARNVTSAFHNVDRELKLSRDALNETIMHETVEISNLTGQIADLNVKINEFEVGDGSEANDLRDQRDMALSKLASKINIRYYVDKDNMLVVRGPRDALLVERGLSSKLEVIRNPENDGMYNIRVKSFDGDSFRDITSGVESGSVSGLLRVRDGVAKNLLTDTNELAYRFANQVNGIHQHGFGLNDYAEKTGRNFFNPIGDMDNAALNIEVSDLIVDSPDAISLSSTPNSVGDNVVANELLRLRDRRLFDNNNASFVDFYANYVGVLGTEAVRAKHQAETDGIILADIQARKESISGVSLDEEAAQMIKWQTSFTASSKVITTVDEMIETVLGMKR